MSLITIPEIPYLDPILIDNGRSPYPNKMAIEINGYGNTINNTRLDVTNIGAGGAAAVYVMPPAGGIQMAVVSTSANDAAAGTGIRTVLLEYLDANYAIATETITLNGVTPVNTVATNILRIQAFHAMSVGSGEQAAGDITLTNVAGTVIYARIQLGFNSSRNSIWTVPAGKTAYITHWDGFSGSTGEHYTRMTLRSTSSAGVYLPGVFLVKDTIAAQNGGVSVASDIPHMFPAKTDIKVSVVSDAVVANASANIHVSGWYE